MVESLKNRIQPLLLELVEYSESYNYYAEESFKELEYFQQKIENADKDTLFELYEELDNARKAVTKACQYCYEHSYKEEYIKALDFYEKIESVYYCLETLRKEKFYA